MKAAPITREVGMIPTKNEIAVLRLSLSMTELGVWMPSYLLTSESRQLQQEIPPNEAFGFWAEIFNWRNPANSPQVKGQRLNKVKELCSNLRRPAIWIDDVEYIEVIELERSWYNNNTEIAFQFFRQLQMRVEQRGARWEVVSYGGLQAPSKAFRW